MRRATLNDCRLVCLIEQNPLAANYLLQVLAKDPSIRALLPGELVTLARTQKLSPIFLVDNSGLAMPLAECLRRLRLRYGGAKFIILGEEQSKEDLLRLLWLGIHGFVAHGDVSQVLVSAVHSVFEGGMWISRDVLEVYVQASAAIHRKGSAGREAITLRENQVIELVRRHLSNKEIAATLNIHERTVKFHLKNIFSKFQAKGRRELLDRCATMNGWAGLPLPSKLPQD